MTGLAARVLGLLLVASLGCISPTSRAEPAPQAYRAYVATGSGDDIPFFLELPANCNTRSATVVNGTERIAVACQRFGDRVVLDFPVYGTRISAEASDEGTLTGEWGHSGGGLRDRLPFRARPLAQIDPQERFPPPARPTTETNARNQEDPSGVWQVTFEKHGLAKGIFEQVAPGVLHGTAEVVSEYGDLRFMAGNLRGSELSLSAFDGARAYLLRARLEVDGTIRGEFVSDRGERDRFVAQRSKDFDVSDPLQQVRVLSTNRRVDFAPLLAPGYAGKAVILELFGTWCSNCNDLAVLLAELHREYRDEGLEILGVAYEVSEDEVYNRERLAAYTAKHGIEWQTVIAEGLPEDLLRPAEFSPLEGVPVTFFLNRDRTIHAIYTGFWGPATGVTYRKTAETFRRLTREILAGVSVTHAGR